LITEGEPKTQGSTELRLFEDRALENLFDPVKKNNSVQIIYLTLALGKVAPSLACWWFGVEAVFLDQLTEQLKHRNISKVSVRDYTNSR